MKCMKNKTNETIVRVTDEEAMVMVKGSVWVYCSKSEWKEKVRDIEPVKDTTKKTAKSEKADKKKKKADKQSQKLVSELKEMTKGK